ncbi:MAG: DUF4824 family protein [Pseudomonas sp.]
MITLNARHNLLAGLALILLSNAVALAGAWYNRQGEPESRLQLSERELWPGNDGPRQENSGLALRLDWRRPTPLNASNRYERANLQQEQLLALGFAPLAEQEQDKARHDDTRQALVVLELDGPAYQAELRHTEQNLQQARKTLAAAPDDSALLAREKSAEAELEDERLRQSRLFAVDVGLDAAALRQRYPDRSRYALVHGMVRAWCECQAKPRRLVGQISQLHNDDLNVPYTWRKRLAEQLGNSYYAAKRPPMQVEVSFGQRLEPWISNLHGFTE